MEANELGAVHKNPPSRGHPRPEFAPKLPRPRRRQRGPLPRLADEQQKQEGDSSLSEVRVFRNARTEHASSSSPLSQQEQTSLSLQHAQTSLLLQPDCLPVSCHDDLRHNVQPSMETQNPSASTMHSMEETSMQNDPFLHPNGDLAKRPRQRDFARGDMNVSRRGYARGDMRFSRSWHRVSSQAQSHQRGAILPADDHFSRPMRGAIVGSHCPSLQAPSLPHRGFPLSQGLPHVPPLIAPEPRTSYSFLETKTSFEALWRQLEAAIQTRDGMLMNMKTEIEKALLQTKCFKDDAIKEKEEVEAKNIEALERFESHKEQTGRLKGVREGLEQISTDLSVQVAELNLLLQQVQERQRTMELLASLKDHYEVSEMEKTRFLDKSLQECEISIAKMDKELEASKITSERLERSLIEKTGVLQEIEAGCTLSKVPTERFQTTRKKATLERQLAQNGQELMGHGVALKSPKLEPMS